MNLTLKIWRQKGPTEKGKIVTYPISNIEGDMSFLEMMDVLNIELIEKGEVPVAFDHDCREGICGMCSMNQPHILKCKNLMKQAPFGLCAFLKQSVTMIKDLL